MGNIRAGLAKLVCKKSRGQGCSEQPLYGSWAPASMCGSHPGVFYGTWAPLAGA